MKKISLPQRKTLPHDIPAWVSADSRYFITVNCRQRGADYLCRRHVAEAVLDSIRVYEEARRWYVWLMVVMPDHVHLIATFDIGRGIKAAMRAWKGYLARHVGVDWQAGFFEHRLRTEDEFTEKVAYVRMNPVRKGLVDHPEAWEYVRGRTD